MRHQVNIPASVVPAAAGSSIYVFHAGTQVQVSDTIYADSSSSTTLSNPYVHPGGKINFCLPRGLAVDIGVKPTGAASPVISQVGAITTQAANYGQMKVGGRVVDWFRY